MTAGRVMAPVRARTSESSAHQHLLVARAGCVGLLLRPSQQLVLLVACAQGSMPLHRLLPTAHQFADVQYPAEQRRSRVGSMNDSIIHAVDPGLHSCCAARALQRRPGDPLTAFTKGRNPKSRVPSLLLSRTQQSS